MPAATHATLPLPGLSPIEGKPIIARFDGGALSSDGGLLALREIEERLGIARGGSVFSRPSLPGLTLGGAGPLAWHRCF